MIDTKQPEVIIGDWKFSGVAEITDGAAWLEQDAAYLREQVVVYRARGEEWVADLIDRNARHSAAMAARLRAALTPKEPA